MAPLDANQITRTVYDPITGGLTTVPAHVSDTVWASALAANVSHTLSPVNVLPYRVMGITVTWTGLSVAGGTLTFQGSTNGTNYFNIGSPYTMTGTSGAEAFSVVDEPYEYVQIVYSPGATTTGTISADYILRA
jgi:hypothetical protein